MKRHRVPRTRLAARDDVLARALRWIEAQPPAERDRLYALKASESLKEIIETMLAEGETRQEFARLAKRGPSGPKGTM